MGAPITEDESELTGVPEAIRKSHFLVRMWKAAKQSTYAARIGLTCFVTVITGLMDQVDMIDIISNLRSITPDGSKIGAVLMVLGALYYAYDAVKKYRAAPEAVAEEPEPAPEPEEPAPEEPVAPEPASEPEATP